MSALEAAGWLLLALVGLVGASLCAGGEMGLYSVNRVRLTLRARGAAVGRSARGQGPAASRRAMPSAVDRSARRLRAELDQPARMLASLLIGYNLFSWLNSLGTTALLTARGYGEGALVLLNAFVLGPVLFVLCDALPKELFRAAPDRLTYPLALPLKLWRLLLTATLILPTVQAMARGLSAVFRGGDESAIPTARERIAALLKEGARHGAISDAQATLMDRAFALRDTRVDDEMVPWASCAKVQADWDRARVVEFLTRHPQSRFPLVDARGAVLGVVEQFDLCLSPQRPLRELAAPMPGIPTGTLVLEALVTLRGASASMALITDHGRPVGVVTAKDLVEPLTGELSAY